MWEFFSVILWKGWLNKFTNHNDIHVEYMFPNEMNKRTRLDQKICNLM